MLIDNTNSNTKQLRDLLSTYGHKWSKDLPTRAMVQTSFAINNVVTNMEDISVSYGILRFLITLLRCLVPECTPKAEGNIYKVIRVNWPNLMKASVWKHGIPKTILTAQMKCSALFTLFHLDLSCLFKNTKILKTLV